MTRRRLNSAVNTAKILRRGRAGYALVLMALLLPAAQGFAQAPTAPAAAAGTTAVADPAAPAVPVAAPPVAAAAKPAPQAPDGYEPVTGMAAAQTKVEPVPLVVISYMVIWALTLFYLVFLWRKQGTLRAEIEALAARLNALEK